MYVDDVNFSGFCIVCALKELITDPATDQEESGAVCPLKILNNLEGRYIQRSYHSITVHFYICIKRTFYFLCEIYKLQMVI